MKSLSQQEAYEDSHTGTKQWKVKYNTEFGKKGEKTKHYWSYHFGTPADIIALEKQYYAVLAKSGISAAELNRQIHIAGLHAISNAFDVGLVPELKATFKAKEIEATELYHKNLWRIYQSYGEEGLREWAEQENIPQSDIDDCLSRILDFTPVESFADRVRTFLAEILKDGPLHTDVIKERCIESTLDPDLENWDNIKQIATREGYTKNHPSRGYWSLTKVSNR